MQLLSIRPPPGQLPGVGRVAGCLHLLAVHQDLKQALRGDGVIPLALVAQGDLEVRRIPASDWSATTSPREKASFPGS